MIIGVPKEIKTEEYRVGIVPSGVRTLVESEHRVVIEAGAGAGSGISDDEYIAAGAQILNGAKEVYDASDMIMKVKEPQPSEFNLFKDGQILYTYLHLAAEPEVTKMLLSKKIKSVAYETIERGDRMLPLLRPMSEVAGRMAVHRCYP